MAVLIDYMDFLGGGYETELRNSFQATCCELDLNLLLVYGRALADPHPWGAAHNAVYQLIHPDKVDGLVMMSTALARYCGVAGLREMLDRYRSMALCSVGLAVPGVPSIVVDNRPGMEAAVEHVIRQHGCRRLAFIAGSPENADAKVRFEAYRTVLDRCGVPFDPSLVANGDFVRRAGELAMEEILRCGRPDAVVAANDSMALGAVAALKQRGLRVPRDVAVTGFDDLPMARLGDPPLTTVGQPLVRMAELAIRLVAQQLAGATVTERTELSAPLVVRQSCGCNRRAFSTRARPRRSRSELAELVARALGGREPEALGIAERLLAALDTERPDRSDAFLGVLADVLAEIGDDNERYQGLQMSVTCLRDELGSNPELDDLWHEARTLIALTNTYAQMQQRLANDEEYHRLSENAERCSIALDLPSLSHALCKGLPSVGVHTAFVSRCLGSPGQQLEPFLCLLDGLPQESAAAQFPSHHLIPPDAYPEDRRRTLLVFPLAFETQHLGLAVFEYSAVTSAYQLLRDQISAALRAVGLHQEVVQQTRLRERSIQEQERISTTKRIQSLSVLAGGVAHDLNNVLGPLMALPDVMLRELDDAEAGRLRDLSELRADLETIKSSALRATQTIKDLLTLGRQGRTPKQPLDVNQAVATCLAAEPIRLMKDATKGVELGLDLHPEALIIQASEAHLIRAVANLVRNAVEAVEGKGKVLITTRRVSIVEPAVGYEVVEPGDYAAIVVADTGKGIPEPDVGRVFEPFFSNKRLGEQSGSGLGLAIVHGVVKEHCGFVNVDSVVGRGTTFTLYFPCAAGAVEAATRISLPPGGSARVLLVDDEPVQLRTARRVLTRLGYQVDTAESAGEAYQRFVAARGSGRSPYDLVILDVILRDDQDGLELLDRIRRLFPEQAAVVASGHAPNERAELAVERGLAWLAKPYTADALARAVQAGFSANHDLAVSQPSGLRPSVPPWQCLAGGLKRPTGGK